MKTYVYTGPVTTMTLKGGRELQLVPGQVELDENDPRTSSLFRRGYLVEPPAPAPAKAPASKRAAAAPPSKGTAKAPPSKSPKSAKATPASKDAAPKTQRGSRAAGEAK